MFIRESKNVRDITPNKKVEVIAFQSLTQIGCNNL